jgi:hypothetical protein
MSELHSHSVPLLVLGAKRPRLKSVEAHPAFSALSVSANPRELPRWLLKKIIKDADKSENEFRELL